MSAKKIIITKKSFLVWFFINILGYFLLLLLSFKFAVKDFINIWWDSFFIIISINLMYFLYSWWLKNTWKTIGDVIIETEKRDRIIGERRANQFLRKIKNKKQKR